MIDKEILKEESMAIPIVNYDYKCTETINGEIMPSKIKSSRKVET